MGFLKKQWRIIVFALACLASVGTAVWQFTAARSVVEAMNTPLQLGRDLKSAQAAPMYNQNWINAKAQENAGNVEQYSRALDDVRRRQQNNSFDGPSTPRKPLVNDVLPKADKTTPRSEFRRRYDEEFKRLSERLRGGVRPSDLELQQAVENAAKKAEAERLLLSSPWAIGKVEAAAAAAGQSMDRARSLWSDARVQYSVERARAIRMYVDPEALRPHDLLAREQAPSVHEIWQAQMSLWIQQDVVLALARVNEAAARRFEAQGHPDRDWVAYLPVKRLMSLGIGPVLGGGGSGGGSNAPAGSVLYVSFTRMQNNDKVFMVPMSLKLVVEADAVPAVLDALVDVSFITPVNLSYEEMHTDWRQVGYVYGSKSVIQLNLNLEGYYLHSVFDPFMPDDIKEALKQPFGTESGTGGS